MSVQLIPSLQSSLFLFFIRVQTPSNIMVIAAQIPTTQQSAEIHS